MPRASDILVVLTYAMIAVVAALAFDRLGLMSAELAWMMGALVFLIAGQVHAAAVRAQERKVFETEIHQLKAANLSMLDELGAAQERIDALAEAPVMSVQAASQSAPAEDYQALSLNHPLSGGAEQPLADERLVAEILARLDGERAPEPLPVSV